MVALGCPGGASWMLGTANCLNGAVITLVSYYLISSLFMFLALLIPVNFITDMSFMRTQSKIEGKKIIRLHHSVR